MRQIGRTVTTTLILVAGLLTPTTTATAAPPSAPGMVRHYNDPHSNKTTTADQCAKPVSERTGAWLCPKTNTSIASGSCSYAGCWYYNNNFWAEFDGDGVYGYGGTTIGEASFYIEVKFNGGNSTSKPFQFETSRGVKTAAASGERIYFSTAHPEGASECCLEAWTGGSYPAMTLINCFGSGGYSAYQNTDAWAGVVHQFQWSDPSSAYPGTWWAWVKSPKFQRNSSGSYILANPPQMGTAWYGSGWDPI